MLVLTHRNDIIYYFYGEKNNNNINNDDDNNNDNNNFDCLSSFPFRLSSPEGRPEYTRRLLYVLS